MTFTTIDVDNDLRDGENCAADEKRGGWWYNCVDSNINGLYGPWSTAPSIYWYSWQVYVPMKKTCMMIKRHP